MKFLKEYKFPLILFLIISLFYYLLIVKNVFAYKEFSTCRDTAINTSVTLNSETFTKLLDENRNDIKRVFCNTAEAVWIYLNLRSVETSVDETGILLDTANNRCFTMNVPAIYTGVVTAISSAGNPKITILAY